jgi:hypothetical protein
MNKKKITGKGKISDRALRQFAENRRLANKGVQKAIEENRKMGIPDEIQFAR